MSSPTHASTIIIGAGLAGLSTAYHLKSGYQLLEAQAQVGGECSTDHVLGYHFDKAGHLLHLNTSSMTRLVQRLCPGAWQLVARDARIHLLNKEGAYPFQANLFPLPPTLKGQALMDYLKAATTDKKSKPAHFEAWSRQTFGDSITDLFVIPYNEKLWTVPASRLTLEWMGRFMPRPELERVLLGAFQEIKAGGGYNASFYYPHQGGIEQLAQALAKNLNHLQLSSPVEQVDVKRKTITIKGGEQRSWQTLVSTMPLPALVARLQAAPARIKTAAQKLNWNSVLVLNLGIKRPRVHDAHWLYFPEKKYRFYRVGFPGNFGHVAPPGRSALYVEVALPAGTGWDQRFHWGKTIKQDLMLAGLLKENDDIEAEHYQYLPYAYVIFDRHYHQARKTVLDYLARHQVLSIGRWGQWEYSAMEDALLAGRAAAEKIKSQSNKGR